MNASNRKLGYFAGATALVVGLGILGSSTGCEEAAKQCGIECSAKGVAEGNGSVSGVFALDGFFGAVVNFNKRATAVASGIDAELDGLKKDFGLTVDKSAADLAAEIKAQVTANVQGSLKIDYQAPACQVDASASLEARAQCEAEVKCTAEVEPPVVSVECSGSCEVDVSAKVSCSAGAEIKCTYTRPSVACNAECKGSCTVDANVAGACEGSCSGNCMGECNGSTSNGGACAGTCKGTCTGECKLDAQFAASCQGKCDGECTIVKPDGACEGAVRAECDAMASAKVSCEGRCDGEVTPPKAHADCEAAASCEATAKAEANLTVECTPPSLSVSYALKAEIAGNVTARAAFEAKIGALKARLPRLLAAIKRSKIVLTAGADLTAAAGTAIDGTIAAIKGDLDLAVVYKLTNCVPDAITESTAAIKDATTNLTGSTKDASDVLTGVGMDLGKM